MQARGRCRDAYAPLLAGGRSWADCRDLYPSVGHWGGEVHVCKAHGGKAQPLTRVAVGREGVGRSKQFPGGPSAQLVRPGHAQQRSPGLPCSASPGSCKPLYLSQVGASLLTAAVARSPERNFALRRGAAASGARERRASSRKQRPRVQQYGEWWKHSRVIRRTSIWDDVCAVHWLGDTWLSSIIVFNWHGTNSIDIAVSFGQQACVHQTSHEVV